MSENHIGGNIQNEITREEHDGTLNAKRISLVSAATIYTVSSITGGVITLSVGDIEIGAVEVKNAASDDRLLVTPRGSLLNEFCPLSYYQQASLISGYVYYGFTTPGNNPTTTNFRLLRETINTGEVLYANGNVSLTNIWSAASLASISYL